MANEKRLIDRNEIFPNGTFFANAEDPLKSLDELIKRIWSIPAVDAVEVVRCCNCSYWNPRYETMGMCMKHNSIVTFTKPDFYCAWGKGKNDGICKED